MVSGAARPSAAGPVRTGGLAAALREGRGRFVAGACAGEASPYPPSRCEWQVMSFVVPLMLQASPAGWFASSPPVADAGGR
ncbi:protein of unknown function [Burkholderia multivorans]